ncbi:lysophospholipid acyltransferase family protein [Hymenobacter sp. BT635]|uniref:Lysophospholipid acyltransferase family protein n=1 Tax=Hymenobacter nitidus TaxID=2880929 RepID=A0ABS8AB63_9BACT|nr:lysophospholipid acyltransferase family protein [Hymenobacter nitidus]MCB2377640.1 lysophospholipid acyltransferase family protein [Hymenobacter nitidus]
MTPHATPRKYAWFYLPLEWLLLSIARLPFPVLYGFAYGLYGLMAYVVRYRRRVVLENLRNSFPEKSEKDIQRIQKEFYWHFAQVMVEILKLGVISDAELRRRVRIHNPELLSSPFAQGRTVLALGSHAGNWEWILPSGALEFPNRAYGVYKPLSNPFFEHFLYKLRTRSGAHLIPMRDTLRDLIKRRTEGRAMSMLTDQAAGPEDRPYWTQFLNQDTSFYSSADRLASQFSCPVVYVNIKRTGRGFYDLVILPLHDGNTPLDKEAYVVTEAFARHLERDIQAAPANYLWTHRRWKHKRVV